MLTNIGRGDLQCAADLTRRGIRIFRKIIQNLLRCVLLHDIYAKLFYLNSMLTVKQDAVESSITRTILQVFHKFLIQERQFHG